VLLEDIRGVASVDLDILGYEFPAAVEVERGWDWDANWLVIRGQVTTADRSWSFTSPCLTTVEAAAIGRWLRQVARGEVDPATDPGLGGRDAGYFVEPNLAVRLGAANENEVTLLWSFEQESAPPEATDDQRYREGFPVELTLARQALAPAAEEWDQATSRYPVRGTAPGAL
jgi:hypothetical protein